MAGSSRKLKSGKSMATKTSGRRSRAAASIVRSMRHDFGSTSIASTRPVTEKPRKSPMSSAPAARSRSPPNPKACDARVDRPQRLDERGGIRDRPTLRRRRSGRAAGPDLAVRSMPGDPDAPVPRIVERGPRLTCADSARSASSSLSGIRSNSGNPIALSWSANTDASPTSTIESCSRLQELLGHALDVLGLHALHALAIRLDLGEI